MWSIKRIVVGIVVTLVSLDVSGQSMTLIPDRSTSINSYSMGEWIAQASGLGWVSYDRIQGTFQSQSVYVRGMPLATEWNGSAWFGLPNWPVSDLDSVVIYEPGSIVHGFAAPDGAIDIYPRAKSGFTADFGVINATRDPGTLIGTPYDSPNVERIREFAHLAWIRESRFTRIDVTSHSYSVGLGMDGKPYSDLYNRTYDPSQPNLFPYQTRISLTNGQQWTGIYRRTDFLVIAHVDPQHYLWDEGLNRESTIRTFSGHLAIRNEPKEGQGWRWLASGGGIRHNVLRFEPTNAEPLESSYQAAVGYAAKRWDAHILASELGGGVGLGRTGHRWRADAVLETHQQLVSLSTNQLWYRAGVAIVAKRFQRLRVEFPVGLQLTYIRYSNVPTKQNIRVDWRRGIGLGSHRLDAVAGWLAWGESDPRFSKVQARAVWRWQAHETFGIAMTAGHRSGRRFAGAPFEQVPGHTDLGLHLDQTLFNGQMRMELGFRNLLDQMDTDHPDGLIHPMSVEVRMRMAL